MAKFKVVKVSLFGYQGKDYRTGDIVELSEEDVKRLTPCDYLEPSPEPEKPNEPKKPEK
jgi:hypothetical protein